MSKHGKSIVVVLVIWFVFALSASALELFNNPSAGFGLGIALAAVTPLVVFSLRFRGSQRFREFALHLNPRILTSLQSWRIAGFTIVLLGARNVLPASFALPAGYGDMAIGITAAFLAWNLAEPKYRSSFILWQSLGILDLLAAVGLGATATLLDP